MSSELVMHYTIDRQLDHEQGQCVTQDVHPTVRAPFELVVRSCILVAVMGYALEALRNILARILHRGEIPIMEEWAIWIGPLLRQLYQGKGYDADHQLEQRDLKVKFLLIQRLGSDKSLLDGVRDHVQDTRGQQQGAMVNVLVMLQYIWLKKA
jgi:hypothetical protein